jgi:hypothetical protein
MPLTIADPQSEIRPASYQESPEHETLDQKPAGILSTCMPAVCLCDRERVQLPGSVNVDPLLRKRRAILLGTNKLTSIADVKFPDQLM